MKPLSGMWLYINLGFAIFWDALGFVLFIIGLIPAVQAVAVAISPFLDIIAFLTDLIFCIIYQGYVKVYNTDFKLYQIKRIREVMLLSKRSGAAANNPISQKLLRQTQKINQYMIDKFSNYVINFTVRKIQYSIMTSVVEFIPWVGDFSPSWTIKANLHLREHKATARELKIKNQEFENSLAKWRGSLRIGGVRKFKSRNNIPNIESVPTKIKIPKNRSNSSRLKYLGSQSNLKSDNIQSTRNNLSSDNIRYEQGQREMSQAANNIRPVNRSLDGNISITLPTQKENKLSNLKSGVRKTAFMGGQLVYSIPQSSESDDEELRYRKPVINNIKPFKKSVLSDMSITSTQSPNYNNISNNNKLNNATLAGNDIKSFARNPQNQVSGDRVSIKK